MCVRACVRACVGACVVSNWVFHAQSTCIVISWRGVHVDGMNLKCALRWHFHGSARSLQCQCTHSHTFLRTANQHIKSVFGQEASDITRNLVTLIVFRDEEEADLSLTRPLNCT